MKKSRLSGNGAAFNDFPYLGMDSIYDYLYNSRYCFSKCSGSKYPGNQLFWKWPRQVSISHSINIYHPLHPHVLLQGIFSLRAKMCFVVERSPSAPTCVSSGNYILLHHYVCILGTIFLCTNLCISWERHPSAATLVSSGNCFRFTIISIYIFVPASTCASSADALALRQRFVSCETSERPSSAPLCVASGHDPFLWGRSSFAPTCVSSGHELPLHQHVFLLGTIQLPLHPHVFLLGTLSLRAKMCFIVERCPSAPTCASSGNYCRLHHHVDSGNDLHQHQLVNLLGTTSQCTHIGFFWELFPFHYFMLLLGTIFLCINTCFF